MVRQEIGSSHILMIGSFGSSIPTNFLPFFWGKKILEGPQVDVFPFFLVTWSTLVNTGV